MYKSLSSKEIIKTLEAHGFIFKSKKGSHTKYINKDKTVIIPNPKPFIPNGTFSSIVR